HSALLLIISARLLLRLLMGFNREITTEITCCVAFYAARCAMAEASDSRSHFSINSWMSWSKKWGLCFLRFAQNEIVLRRSFFLRRRRLIRRWIEALNYSKML